MSGAEFIAVAGVMSSIIAIVDGIKQVVEAADEAEGLPQVFRQASRKLPIISDILEAAKHSFEADEVLSVEKSVTLVVNDCQGRWNMLNELFRKVIPEDKASRVERYHKAATTLGKKSKVEILMKGMLDDILLLASIKTMTVANVGIAIQTVTSAQEEKIRKAVKDVEAWPPSIADHIFEERAYTNNFYGDGQQYLVQGGEQNNFRDDSRQIHSGGGSLTYNETRVTNNGVLHNYRLQDPKEADAQVCLNALFLTNPKVDQDELISAKGSRVDGTCIWIKTNPMYESWFRDSSQLLWVSGGPGKGKTMLSIFLAEDFEKTARDSEDVSALQYFCDNKQDKRNTAVAILRGMIFQLLQLKPKLIDHILPSFRIEKESLFNTSSIQSLWRIFENMLRDPTLGTVHCVIDGLDECDDASLTVLLGKFKTLFSPKNIRSHQLKLIVVSREFPDCIPRFLSKFPHIQLDPGATTEIRNDIHLFIEATVDELSELGDYGEKLRVHVKDVFRHRAQGTFLWVALVAKSLERYKATEVRKELEQFPPGLDELYSRMLLQIDTKWRKRASRILLWTVMAIRPLTLSELGTAVEIDVKPSDDFTLARVAREWVSYCGSLLLVQNDIVNLVHQSAKDYLLRKTCDSSPVLESFRMEEEAGNLKLARKCFQYLHAGAFEKGGVDLRSNSADLKDFPLILYAVLYWPEHAHALADPQDIFDTSLPFYDKKSQIRDFWFKTYFAVAENRRPPDSFPLLHFASYFDFLPLARELVQMDQKRQTLSQSLNERDSDGNTALIWAVREGHIAIVQLLLDRGANIEAKDENNETALILAASHGHEVLVLLLIERGANIEARDNEGMTVLFIAALIEHESMVQLLLDRGANIEARDNEGMTVLFRVTGIEHESMLQLLLDRGANIEARDNKGMTVLFIVALMERESMVQLLLDRGANIEARDNIGTTALVRVALKGRESMVQLLLDRGANIEARDNKGMTVLFIVALMERESMVQLLLDRGANIEARDNIGTTALVRVALKGRESMVQLLLDRGANIEAESNIGLSAKLILARWRVSNFRATLE